MTGVRHPVDLPEGLPHDVPGEGLNEARCGCAEGRPRAVARSDCVAVDEMPHDSQRGTRSTGQSQTQSLYEDGGRDKRSNPFFVLGGWSAA